jgi:hypothetical protein
MNLDDNHSYLKKQVLDSYVYFSINSFES